MFTKNPEYPLPIKLLLLKHLDLSFYFLINSFILPEKLV